jgi:hypothetical protein
MTNAKDFISHLQASGFSIDCEDQRLLISPADRLTDELKHAIRENKAALLAELKRPVTDVTVTSPLQPRYTVTVSDATTDPVLVQVTIDGLATFDLAIPLAKYDGMAIIDAIEPYSPIDAFSDEVALRALADGNERIVGLPDAQEREAA